jgi:hypothetical protein
VHDHDVPIVHQAIAESHHRPSPRRIGGKRRLTGDDWMIDVLVIA